MSDSQRIRLVKLTAMVLLGTIGLVLVISLIGTAGVSISFSWFTDIPSFWYVLGGALLLAIVLSLWSGDHKLVWSMFAFGVIVSILSTVQSTVLGFLN